MDLLKESQFDDGLFQPFLLSVEILSIRSR